GRETLAAEGRALPEGLDGETQRRGVSETGDRDLAHRRDGPDGREWRVAGAGLFRTLRDHRDDGRPDASRDRATPRRRRPDDPRFAGGFLSSPACVRAVQI